MAPPHQNDTDDEDLWAQFTDSEIPEDVLGAANAYPDPRTSFQMDQASGYATDGTHKRADH